MRPASRLGVLSAMILASSIRGPAKTTTADVTRQDDRPHDGSPRMHALLSRGGERTGFRTVANGVAVSNSADVAKGSLVLPDLHLTTDVALPIIGVPIVEAQGLTGRGVYVGVVDSGFDVTHPALRDANGKTRLAWLLDYTKRVRGVYAPLESKFSLPTCLSLAKDGKAGDGGSCDRVARCASPTFPCGVTRGAIYAAADVDALLAASPPASLPTDEEGHGTHAMAIAAGSKLATTKYRGVASEASLVGVKADGAGFSINASAVLAGMAFVYDRADAAGAPAVVNLSLTSDFVPRDGTDPFGPAVAAVARGPGHIVVAAAGNGGDPGAGLHQSVSVSPGESVVLELGADVLDGLPSEVDVIVSPHPGADIRIGCRHPDGTWVDTVERGHTRSGTIGDAVANVIYDPADFDGLLAPNSTSAFVRLQGTLERAALYGLVLEGSGAADLWISGGVFTDGVREQTVGSPAMHRDVIAVGATVTRLAYRSRAGEDLVLRAAVYDAGGMIRDRIATTPAILGQIGSFSGSGPGPDGAVKPNVVAPGVIIFSAASRQRDPKTSIFYGDVFCPPRADGASTTDPLCAYIDDDHVAGTGTSFAAPFVTGAVAVLLQVDPKLDQTAARIALEAGAHVHRTAPVFLEQAGTGELDVAGAVDIVRGTVAKPPASPALVAPSAARSWITPSSHYVPSDGTRPLEVVVHLRGDDGRPADGFDAARFAITIVIDSDTFGPRAMAREAMGMWRATFDIPADRATRSLTVHAELDHRPAAAPVTIPIARDPWQARYPTTVSPSCAIVIDSGRTRLGSTAPAFLAAALATLLARRRRRYLQAGRSGCSEQSMPSQ